MNPQIFQWASNDSALVGLLTIDSKFNFYQDEIPQGVRYPAVRWNLVAGAPENYYDTGAGIDNGRFQFDVYAPTQAVRRVVLNALIEMIEQHGYVISYNGEGRDELLTKQFFSSIDVSLWVLRT